MTPAQPSRLPRFILVIALPLVAVLGLSLVLIGLSTPGYAGSKTPNLILQALLQETPTPVPTPVAAACGIHIAQRMTVVTDTMGIELSNDGAAATVEAITLEWPVANGELIEIKLGERAIWNGAVAGSSATVFLDLTETFPTIKTGEQISLTLRFSNTALPDDYFVVLHLGNSCYAVFDSSRNAAHLGSCFVTSDRFDVNQQEAALVVRNTTTGPISFSQLLVFWPEEHGPISSIQIDDGENLISEPAETSPVRIPLTADPTTTLQPEQSLTLRLIFHGNAPLVNYTIILQSDECQSVFSNAEAPAECPLRQEGDFQVIEQTVGLALLNPSETSPRIERIWLTFPVSNTALVDVTLDGAPIVDQSSSLFPKTSSPASMTAGVDLLPNISLPANNRATVGFLFDQPAALQHYTVELDLSDGCRVLATTRTEDVEPCQMQVDGDTPIRAEGNSLWFAIRNIGQVRAELRALQVDWTAQFNGALTGVSLGGVPFWVGERTGGSATVTHNTNNDAPVVEPGQSTELQLTFANEVVEYPYVFRLDFAEGCQLSYSTQSDLAMPPPVEIGGTIDELPPNLFAGTWLIRLSVEQVLSVQVTPQTVIESEELTPLVNDFVRARVLRGGQDEYLATYIRVYPNWAGPIQLTGLIEDVDPQPQPRYIQVQSTRVDITPDTVVQGDLQAGWLADVEGLLRADGSVVATSIYTTQPEDNVRRVDFQGFVDDWQEISDEETIWIVSGMEVYVNRYTTIHHGIQPGQQPEPNAEVRVAGDLLSAGMVRAQELWYGPGADIIEFNGVILEFPNDTQGAQFLGTWKIEDSADGTLKTVLVDEATFLDISEATPAVNSSVQVRAQQNPDGNLHALWMKVLPPD